MPTTLGLITIKELLRDPQYREFFTTVPKLPAHYTPDTMPWKLLVLKPHETAWRSKRFGTYQEAFAAFKKMLPTITNAAINCPPLGFQPPHRLVRIKGKFETVRGKQVQQTKLLVWKPQLEPDMDQHIWCPHCRRPSVFAVRAIPAKQKDYWVPAGAPMMRCTICGASERIIDLRDPMNTQKWRA